MAQQLVPNVRLQSELLRPQLISSHQVPIVADLLFEELKEEDVEMTVLPGGLPGATSLDAHAGLDIDRPYNYFPHDDENLVPLVSWKSTASLIFSNWLNYFVYQRTPYDISTL